MSSVIAIEIQVEYWDGPKECPIGVWRLRLVPWEYWNIYQKGCPKEVQRLVKAGPMGIMG